MPRARSIKPAFFKNEVLAQMKPHHRLLFIGLWTLADREGRLEDRPARIRAEIFPYENVDIDASLSALAEHGFIRRYAVDFAKFIQINNFEKHQNPHVKEQASTIPAPGKHGAKTPDSLLLTPDSGLLTPDTPAAPEPDPVRATVDTWNDFAAQNALSPIKKLDDRRRSAIRARLKDKDFDVGAILAKIAASDFLLGHKGNWKGADFDFVFCSAHNYVKILEGKYDNATSHGPTNGQGGRVRPIITDAELRKSVMPPGSS